MAEPKNVSFDGVMKELKQRIFAPIYYLMGDEAYYIDLIAPYLYTHLKTDHPYIDNHFYPFYHPFITRNTIFLFIYTMYSF